MSKKILVELDLKGYSFEFDKVGMQEIWVDTQEGGIVLLPDDLLYDIMLRIAKVKIKLDQQKCALLLKMVKETNTKASTGEDKDG